MNSIILTDTNDESNAFSKRRTDFDAQEREIAEFIKKGGKVINLDNTKRPKKKSVKSHHANFNNSGIKSEMHLVLCYLKRSGKRMTGLQIQEKFGISATTLGVQTRLLNAQAGKTLIENEKIRDENNRLKRVYWATRQGMKQDEF
ncbi:hypothetical protein C0145_06410 [Moraxella catarrhalis]|uniref:Uncharacterized protein n=1 Tax=Moraxella catarrhalis TaxID=480 RepID=A0A3Q9GEB2_MORCA|nr:hypothetical protein [Moraxella catarrhalis]AZQ93814.1 hypothetical protein EJK53_1566 [Moraxella catarrhalis]AZQ93885.1 hypothetical protein EJK53_1640 [Moraxella catarrhalis]MDE4520043.1 hypothetical protein [Moraxella catarrhalis]MPX14477.1 hypothetical protein [Moraxella catarrhalis]MPX27928.1 hypothetical protein [Moraxella catarrhalis]